MPKFIARARQLSESAAWRAVARTIRQHGAVHQGICLEAWLLCKLGYITEERWGRMLHRASEGVYAMGEPAGAFAFPPGTHAEERAMIADLLALEAAEDERWAKQKRSLTRQTGSDGAKL